MATSCRRNMAMFLVKVVLFLTVLTPALGDTPANCTYENIRGTWQFLLGSGGNDRSLNCANFSGPVKSRMQVTLDYPNVAVDQFGNMGFWTIIYNQGFEVVVAGRKYFAFSMYTGDGKMAKSFCNQSLPGWSHDTMGHDWACYSGKKIPVLPYGSKVSPASASAPTLSTILKFEPVEEQPFYNDMDFIARINQAQSSWRAGAYPRLEGASRQQLLNMAGGPASRIAQRPSVVPVSREVFEAAAKLPLNFDWRNVEGDNFVSPVRNQGEMEERGLILDSAIV